MSDTPLRPSSPTSPRATTVAPRKRLGRRIAALLALIVLVAIGGLALYVWGAMRWSYSDGERAGYVQKFSRKGWICKTWEGELAMATMPGTMPEIFHVTVRDGEVAARINQSLGQRVAVSYAQHRGLPTSCFGETEYFVKDVKVVGP